MKLFVGAKGLIVRHDGKVLIVRESSKYDDGTEEGNWDVVGGRIETEELLLDGLQREIMEESGLTVSIGETLGVTENFPVIKGKSTHIIRVYYICSTNDDTVVLSKDHDEFAWIDPLDYGTYSVMEDVADIFVKYLKTL